MTRTLRLLHRFLIAMPIAAVACTAKSDGPAAPTIESATFAASLGVDLTASTRTSAGLYYRDLIVGTGTVAASGNALAVHYAGFLTSGTEFDYNIAPQTPYPFTLGNGSVIAGWDQGVPGMRVGGRRQLIIPPNLGYGSAGSGAIPGNSILVFTVDLVTVR